MPKFFFLLLFKNVSLYLREHVPIYRFVPQMPTAAGAELLKPGAKNLIQVTYIGDRNTTIGALAAASQGLY